MWGLTSLCVSEMMFKTQSGVRTMRRRLAEFNEMGRELERWGRW